MNPDLKDLRVAVVPTETDNGINQQSTYEEIVACEETTYYSVPDYFKAQNDEELGLHWSFLLDYDKKVDCTGMNTDGIDYHSDLWKKDPKPTKAELVSWESLRKELKYPEDDINDGFVFGLAYLENDDIIDYEWFKTEEERTINIKENNIQIVNRE